MDFGKLATEINAVSFDHVFQVRGGEVLSADGEYSPDVHHSESNDVDIYGDGWDCLKGYTIQDSYSGAVMHRSESVGTKMARDMAEMEDGTVFAFVEVRDVNDENAVVGWVLAYKYPSS